jgi:hypothetical protein
MKAWRLRLVRPAQNMTAHFAAVGTGEWNMPFNPFSTTTDLCFSRYCHQDLVGVVQKQRQMSFMRVERGLTIRNPVSHSTTH